MTTVIAVALVLVILVIAIGPYWRRRSVAFEGTVSDKDVKEIEVDNNTNARAGGVRINLGSNIKHKYIIKVETDSGKKIKWRVSQGKYEIIKIGDRVTKHSGTTDIEVTQNVARSTDQSPVTNNPATSPNSISN